MKLFATSQIRKLDEITIQKDRIASIDLMERASKMLFSWLDQHESLKELVVFCGAGNNGGDGLAVARMALQKGINVKVYILKSNQYSDDFIQNRDRLKQIPSSQIEEIDSEDQFPEISPTAIVLDALFGSGLNRPIEGMAKKLIQHLNQLRVKIISVDIPSGLMGEDNSGNNLDSIIRANVTLSFQFPKLAFLLPKNEEFVGDWHVLDIGLHKDAIQNTPTNWHLITHDLVQPLLNKRKKFSHKGSYGHALLISGSYGKMGAAVLASKACLKSGVGLLTTHVPRLGYQIIQTTVPEAMVSIDRSDMLFSEFPNLNNFDAIGIGPGLDAKVNSQKAFFELLKEIKDKPLVIDADGLNILGQNKEWLELLPDNAILTPHPKEFKRLVGSWESDYERLEKLNKFCANYNVVTILKGAYSTVCLPNGECYFNSTGNPGMATAGSGDVLTGVILSLLAQNYSLKQASIIGVYLHGLAGDIFKDSESEEALIANDIINNLGKGFKEIQKIRYYHH